jgi:hypothetical protein
MFEDLQLSTVKCKFEEMLIALIVLMSKRKIEAADVDNEHRRAESIFQRLLNRATDFANAALGVEALEAEVPAKKRAAVEKDKDASKRVRDALVD